MSSPVASDVILEEITINASADRVFDALANPSERVAWWSVPGRFRTTGMESDLRPGGRWSMSGTRADGSPFTIRGEYRIVERPGRLAFGRGCGRGPRAPLATEGEERPSQEQDPGTRALGAEEGRHGPFDPTPTRGCRARRARVSILDGLARRYTGAAAYFGGCVPAELQATETPILCKIRPSRVVCLDARKKEAVR